MNQNPGYTWSINAHNINKQSWSEVWSTVLFVACLSGVKLLRKERRLHILYPNLQTENTAKPLSNTHIYFETQICTDLFHMMVYTTLMVHSPQWCFVKACKFIWKGSNPLMHVVTSIIIIEVGADSCLPFWVISIRLQYRSHSWLRVLSIFL